MFNCSTIRFCFYVSLVAVGGIGHVLGEDGTVGPQAKNVASGKKSKGGGASQYPKEAKDAMKGFHEALKNKDYATALAFCSESVRNASKAYHSEEVFIKAMVPVDAAVKLERIPLYGATRISRNGTLEVVGIFSAVEYEELQWRLELKKTQDRWEIDFKLRPFKVWAATVRDYYERKRKVSKERRDALEKHLHQIRTRLTATRSTVKIGEPILVGLVLHNESPEDLAYDASEVGLNDCITVLDAEGNRIPYTAGQFQTVINNEDIKAGSKAVLLENFDVIRQYAISKPGEYRIRFNGKGLSIGRRFVYEQFELDYRKEELGRRWQRKSDVGYALNEYPSNTVTVTVEK